MNELLTQSTFVSLKHILGSWAHLVLQASKMERPISNSNTSSITEIPSVMEVGKPSCAEWGLIESINSLERTIIEQCQYLVENGWYKPQSQLDRKRLSSLTGLESAMGNPFTLKGEKVRPRSNWTSANPKWRMCLRLKGLSLAG